MIEVAADDEQMHFQELDMSYVEQNDNSGLFDGLDMKTNSVAVEDADEEMIVRKSEAQRKKN